MRPRREPVRLVDPEWAETGLSKLLAEMSSREKMALFEEVRGREPVVPNERARETAKHA